MMNIVGNTKGRNLHPTNHMNGLKLKYLVDVIEFNKTDWLKEDNSSHMLAVTGVIAKFITNQD